MFRDARKSPDKELIFSSKFGSITGSTSYHILSLFYAAGVTIQLNFHNSLITHFTEGETGQLTYI